jgi:hypothetical protein
MHSFPAKRVSGKDWRLHTHTLKRILLHHNSLILARRYTTTAKSDSAQWQSSHLNTGSVKRLETPGPVIIECDNSLEMDYYCTLDSFIIRTIMINATIIANIIRMALTFGR